MSITGKRAAAAVFVFSCFSDQRKVVELEAAGPSQEIRAFSQILTEGENQVEITFEDGETSHFHNMQLSGVIRIIPNWEHGYSGLYVFPAGTDYIIGENDAECHTIFSRILDQAHFVHRDWYQEIAKLAGKLDPLVGTKKCLLMPENIADEVQNRVKYGGFTFPEPTASLTVETEQDRKQKAQAEQAA